MLSLIIASLTNVQFILVDLTKRLSKLASEMLNALCPLTIDSLFIFENESDIDFHQLPDKTTLLFSSRQCVSSVEKLSPRINKIFILEHNPYEADQRQQFSTSEDLVCQLVDEIYRCYCQEAQKYEKLGDFIIAKRFEEQANRIYDEVRKAHQKVMKKENTGKSYECPATMLILLKRKGESDHNIQQILQQFKDIVSSCSTFHDEHRCYLYLLANEQESNVFLIVDAYYYNFTTAGFRDLKNVKSLYFFANSTSKDKATFMNPDDLRLQLIYDLIAHYGQLGEECRTHQCVIQAKDMFLKAKKLCHFLT
ncbi:unnamed protein product [Rotaria sp. Silwood1]|nr:unnamed protein product [Rotaria sp. Silwood1]